MDDCDEDEDYSPPPQGNRIEVAREGSSVLLRVIGLGNMNISLILCEFAEAALQAGQRQFAIDLNDCAGMDSTFMGTLVGMADRMREENGWICLVNVSPNHQKLLRQIGAWGMLSVRATFEIDPVETEVLLPGGDPEKRLTCIRYAHQKLIEIDERNRERFGAFLAALGTEMETGSTVAEGDNDADAELTS